MLKSILLVGLGSAGGGIARFLISKYAHHFTSLSFPLGTMAVNILGCFIIGLIYSLISKSTASGANIHLLLATGFCGGFTTFSSFIHENYTMIERGNILECALYTGLSITLGMLALYCAIYIGRNMLN